MSCPRQRADAKRRAAVLGLVLLSLALILQTTADGQAPTPAPAVTLEQPIAWLTEAKRRYADIRDYSCTLVTRESIRGVLGEENVVSFKMRTQPFSVYMRWLAPRKSQNQEVAFVLGRNNNKMRVKAHGVVKGGIAGFQSIDPNDPRVLEQSRHNIYEAGIGSLIEQMLVHMDTERKLNKTVVKVAEYNFANKPCLRVELIRTERRQEYYCYRTVLYLDKDTKLPLRNENYDWPRQGGSPDGELLEMFSYVDLRFNVGLTDADFNR